jgi:beta-mannosidase
MPFEYAHTRKACYQYSWDWAPYMNTMGIWLPAYIHFYDDVKINYIWIRNKEITQKQAVLDIVMVLDKLSANELLE